MPEIHDSPTRADFLRTRLDEEQAIALSVHDDLDSDCEVVVAAGESGACTCGRTDLVLADVDAKRRIAAPLGA